MPFLGSLVGLVIVLFLGAILAAYTGVHTTLKEYAMLFGLGGWPGRLATVHAVVWVVVLYYVGPPEEGLLLYAIIAMVGIGTVAFPFSVNNRTLLRTIEAHNGPVSPDDVSESDGGRIAVSGTVVIEDVDDSESFRPDPVTAPFTAMACAACEWAIKRRHRFSRRPSYTTIDSGELAGDFILDTERGRFGIAPVDPTLLLVSGVGFTGYETTTGNPSATDTAPDSGRLTRAVTGEMNYCETTVEESDVVTVVGTLVDGGDEGLPILTDRDGSSLYIVNDDLERIERVVDRYLRWTPHAAVATLLVGWTYVVAMGSF